MYRRFLGPLLVALLLCIPLRASAAVIHFDELPDQVANGLSFNGVTFHFTVGGLASTDARFGTLVGPGTTAGIHAPNLEGNSTGILTLDFAAPVNHVAFNLAISDALPHNPAAVVSLFNPAFAPAGSVNVNSAVQPGFSFSEGVFNYTGAPLSRISVDFIDAQRFAIDDLAFDLAPAGPGGGGNVPVPAAVWMGSALAGVVGVRRRFSRA
jgi:hypothetical protein